MGGETGRADVVVLICVFALAILASFIHSTTFWLVAGAAAVIIGIGYWLYRRRNTHRIVIEIREVRRRR